MPTTRRLALTAIALIGSAFAAATFVSAQAQDMSPLPEAIKKQGLIRAGIKCDYPPDGFLDAQGKNQGVEVMPVRGTHQPIDRRQRSLHVLHPNSTFVPVD